jgi:pSer/pThr/pTyr-binding forkhead associated (FHA) protein
MATFSVYLGRKLVGEYFFNKGPVIVGRAPESDIYIDQQVISRKHAIIKKEGGVWTVENAGGKNGLFVNGVFTNFQVLKNGDRVEVGRSVITFQESVETKVVEKKREAKTPGAPLYKSMEEVMARLQPADEPEDVWDSKPAKPAAPVLPKRPPRPKPGAPVEEVKATAILSVDQLEEMHGRNTKEMSTHLAFFDKDGKQILIPLDQEQTVLGRGQGADVQIKGGLGFGNRFAVISKEESGVYVSKCSMLTSVKVNGLGVKERCRLMDGDKITIHDTTLIFRQALFNGGES